MGNLLIDITVIMYLKAIRIILAAICIAVRVDMYDNIVFSKNTQEKRLIRTTLTT